MAAAIPSLCEMEGYAWDLLRRANCTGLVRPRASDIIVGTGLPVYYDAPPGYWGWCNFPHGIHLPPNITGRWFERAAAHELTHYHLCDLLIPRHIQDKIVEHVVLCWRMPIYGIWRIIRRWGFRVPRFLRWYGHLGTDVEIITRAAMVRQVAVVVHSSAEGRQVVGNGVYDVNMVLSTKEEAYFVGKVWKSNMPYTDGRGITAWPYRYGGRNNVAIVLDWEAMGLLVAA